MPYHMNPRRRTSPAIRRFFEALVGLALIGGILLMFVAWLAKPRTVDASAFTIAQGDSTADIVRGLKEENIIRSTALFKWALANSGKATKLQPGTYDLRGAKSMDEIIERLAS